MRFVVSTDGLGEALGTLRLLATKSEDLTPMLGELGQDEVARVVQRFEHEEDPQGNPWATLQRPRRKRRGKRRRRGISDKLLQDTGRLKGSIQAQVLGGSVLLVGSNVKYAPFHQFGTVFIPARPFLGVSDDLLASIKELTHAYFSI